MRARPRLLSDEPAPPGPRTRFRERGEPVGESKELCSRLVSHLLQFGGDLRGMLGVLRPLSSGELGLQGLLSGFEGLKKGDVRCLEGPHPPTSLLLPMTLIGTQQASELRSHRSKFLRSC